MAAKEQPLMASKERSIKRVKRLTPGHARRISMGREMVLCPSPLPSASKMSSWTHIRKKNTKKHVQTSPKPKSPQLLPAARCLVETGRSYDYAHSVAVGPEGFHQTAELGVVGGFVVWVLFPPSAFNFKRAWRGQLNRRMHHTF